MATRTADRIRRAQNEQIIAAAWRAIDRIGLGLPARVEDLADLSCLDGEGIGEPSAAEVRAALDLRRRHLAYLEATSGDGAPLPPELRMEIAFLPVEDLPGRARVALRWRGRLTDELLIFRGADGVPEPGAGMVVRGLPDVLRAVRAGHGELLRAAARSLIERGIYPKLGLLYLSDLDDCEGDDDDEKKGGKIVLPR